MITEDFQKGEKVKIVVELSRYYRTEDIVIKAVIVEPGNVICIVDTEHQKGIPVYLKDLKKA